MTKEVIDSVIKSAFLVRACEQKLLDLYAAGHVAGTIHTCLGQEFIAAAIGQQLLSEDYVLSNHRCHGHFLAATGDIDSMFAEILAKTGGSTDGIGGSQHLSARNFYSSGILGGLAPIAAGIAFAKRQISALESSVTVSFLGDGSLAEGVIYETINMAALWQLPVVWVVEDNRVAQSSEQGQYMAGSISARFGAFGVKVVKADVWNWKELCKSVESVFNEVRRGGGPQAIVIDTFRLAPHSKGDDDRCDKLIDKYARKDPVNLLIEDESYKRLFEQTIAHVDSVVDSLLLRPDVGLSKGGGTKTLSIGLSEHQFPSNLRIGAAINAEFQAALSKSGKVLFFGEDISDPYGGAFKLTKGLSSMFPAQVFNTPISEAAMVGLGIGLSMMGYLPVVEIMFGDFLTLAFDQILNHAVKIDKLKKNKLSGLVIRTPMGGGRGYGPTHSQNLEKHFLGIPGLRVIALNNLVAPDCIYQNLLAPALGGVTLMIEDKLLYAKRSLKYAEDWICRVTNQVFPSAYICKRGRGTNTLMISYGGICNMLGNLVMECEEEVAYSDLLCMTQIFPMDLESLYSVLKNYTKFILVEAGELFSGFGAEVISQIIELGILPDKVMRIGAESSIIPAARQLENEVIVTKEKIISMLKEF